MTTATSSGYADFLLAEIRCASLRARLAVADLESIEVALRGKFITVADAIDWAGELGVCLIASSSTATTSST